MTRRIIGPGVCALSLLVLGLALQTGQAAGADPAPAKESLAKGGAVLMPFGPRGPKCTEGLWRDPKDRNQTVKIEVVPTDPPTIKDPEPLCAKESFNGKLTFTLGALPAGHRVEIQFETRYDENGKPHKGPYKRGGDKAKYPVAGRCLLNANDSCEFGSHDREIHTGAVFSYTVYLWDADGNLVDEKDPGIMVIDNP